MADADWGCGFGRGANWGWTGAVLQIARQEALQPLS